VLKFFNNLRDQCHEFLPLDLGVALDDIVIDEPSFELTVAPRLPRRVANVIVVGTHQSGERLSLSSVIRLDDVMLNEPLTLRTGQKYPEIYLAGWHTMYESLHTSQIGSATLA